MDEQVREAIAHIVPIMNSMPLDPNATVQYELLSGGLAWSDEFPKGCDKELFWGEVIQIIRMLLHHRSVIIVGKPQVDRYRDVWEEAIRRFPNWPGFEILRRSSCHAQFFRDQEAKAMAELEQGVH